MESGDATNPHWFPHHFPRIPGFLVDEMGQHELEASFLFSHARAGNASWFHGNPDAYVGTGRKEHGWVGED
jgi:hypothetical protein